jgi:DNA-binding MarR family transcriptional regulator
MSGQEKMTRDEEAEDRPSAGMSPFEVIWTMSEIASSIEEKSREIFIRYGFCHDDFQIITALWQGETDEWMPLAKVRAAAGTYRPILDRLAILAGKDLVHRLEIYEGEPTIAFQLTASGRGLAERLYHEVAQLYDEILAVMPPAELSEFAAQLASLSAVLQLQTASRPPRRDKISMGPA